MKNDEIDQKTGPNSAPGNKKYNHYSGKRISLDALHNRMDIAEESLMN